MVRREQQTRHRQHRGRLREPQLGCPDKFCERLRVLRVPSRLSLLMSNSFLFPNDFVWGAATSAYQIEGYPLADGAGSSIWHRFSHTPGLTENGDTGDVACEHYRR